MDVTTTTNDDGRWHRGAQPFVLLKVFVLEAILLVLFAPPSNVRVVLIIFAHLSFGHPSAHTTQHNPEPR